MLRSCGEIVRRALRWVGSNRSLAASVVRIALGLAFVGGILYAIVWGLTVRMPGESHRGPLPPLSEHERHLADQLRRDVQKLAGAIGERNVFLPQELRQAAVFVEESLQSAGYAVERHTYELQGVACSNLIVQTRGSRQADEILIVGAHYDSVVGCPGANDNASGVAALLALARSFAGRSCDRTLRLAAFVNEEPPWFQTPAMGSLHYARRCRERNENIIGMISLETIGYYSDRPGSQSYPPLFNLFYPSTADFIAFVGNVRSGAFVRQVVGSFRRHADFPSQGGAIPLVPQAGWSDHWAFWKQGYAALMVTDTAPFRYRCYHSAQDTPEQLDYERMARVVAGLERVLAELCGCDP